MLLLLPPSEGKSVPDDGAPLDLASLSSPSLTRHRKAVLKALDARAAGDVVIDCRSAPYAAAWKVPADAEHVAVRVLRELDGKRSVVSHNAKHTRGVLTGHLLTRAEPVHTAEELLKAAYELVGTALLDATLLPGARGASTLELVVS